MGHLWWLTGLLLVGLVTTDNPFGHQLYDAIKVATKRFSGIVGDAAHALRGGYHIGRILQLVGNYSNSFPQDRTGDPVMSSGIDVSFGPADMIAVTARLLTAMKARDPRVAALREANGTLNGRTTVNYDVTLGRQNYQPDATHLWHFHGGMWRALFTAAATGPIAAAGIASVINGESLQSWLSRSPGTSNLDGATITVEDDMFDDADRAALKAATTSSAAAQADAALAVNLAADTHRMIGGYLGQRPRRAGEPLAPGIAEPVFRDRLGPGDRLASGDELWSDDGDDCLVMQDDGNLVLYNVRGKPVWFTGTDGHPGASATFQADGNFAVYPAGGGSALYDTRTEGSGAVSMVLQDDGNLVWYRADSTAAMSSGTRA